MLRFSIFALAVLVLPACSLLQPRPAPQPALEFVASSAPAAGEVHTVAVGEVLVSSAYGLSGVALRADETQVLCEDLSKRIEVPAGQELVASKTAQGQTVYCGHLQWVNTFAGQERTRIDECVLPLDGNRWQLYFNELSCPESFTLSEIEHTAPSEDGRRQELVFTGRSGSQVFLRYRERRGLQADVEQQDVRFDTADDAVVGLKGVRIEVLELNSTSMRYRVISGFDS